MRKLGAAFLASIFTITLASAPARTTPSTARGYCECSAPDGSCSASGTCAGKCTAQCPSNGCNISCTGWHGLLETEVDLQMQNVNNRKLLAELSRRTGKPMSFSSRKPDEPFNLDARGSSVWDLLELLSNSGTVMVKGEDFENLKTTRRALVDGERLSLAVHGLTAGEYVAHLSALSGLPLRVAAGDPNVAVNFNLENVTLTEVLDKILEQTGVQVVNDEDDSGAR